MKLSFLKPALVAAVAISVQFSAQNQPPAYSYTEAFKPYFYQNNATETRSASGQPGHKYWQNSADYVLNATLNEANNEISGSAEITYTNNSFDNLGFLWLQLDQNLFKEDSRGNAIIPMGGSIAAAVFFKKISRNPFCQRQKDDGETYLHDYRYPYAD